MKNNGLNDQVIDRLANKLTNLLSKYLNTSHYGTGLLCLIFSF